jgi:uncharacterized membrane protein
MNWHPDRPPMMWHEPWWHAWQTIIPILLILILGGALIWLVVRMKAVQADLTRGAATTAGPATPPPADAALAHARMRYANGEIDRDSFLAIWRDLGGAPASGGSTRPNVADENPAPAAQEDPPPADA